MKQVLCNFIQIISYKRYLKCTLVQWRLSIYPLCTQVAVGTFFMKSPISYKVNISCSVNVWCVHPFLTDSRNCTNICLFAGEKWLEFTINFNMELLILIFSGLWLLWASIVNEVNHHRTLYRAKRSIFTKSMGVFIINESNLTTTICAILYRRQVVEGVTECTLD